MIYTYASEADFETLQFWWFQSWQQTAAGSWFDLPGLQTRGGTGGAAYFCWLDRHREQLLSQDTDPVARNNFYALNTPLHSPDLKNASSQVSADVGYRQQTGDKCKKQEKGRSAGFKAIKKRYLHWNNKVAM